MAYPVISSIGETSINWYITDLGANWNSSQYQYVYITIGGSASAPVYPPTAGTSRSTGTGSFSGLSPGTTYTAYGYAVVAAGSTHAAGSATFTTASPPPPPPPPSNLTGLTGAAASPTQINTSWNASSGASGYHMYRDGAYITSTTSTSYSYTGLTEYTFYNLTVYPYNANGTGGGQTITVRTSANIVPPTGLSVSSGSGSLSCSWSPASNALSYTVKARRAYDSALTTYNTTATSITISGLQYGITYYVSVMNNHASGTGSIYSSEVAQTTKPIAPTISQNTVTSTSISVNGYVSQGSVTAIYMERYSSTGSWIDTTTLPVTTSGTIVTATYTGLVAGTTYIFRAFARYTLSSVNYDSPYSSDLIIAVSSRPSNFSWTYAKSTGSTVYVHNSEWNALTTRINAFRSYKGLAAATFTTVSAGMLISAAIFNQARNAIAAMSPPTSAPSTATSLSTAISASALNGLVSSLNSIV